MKHGLLGRTLSHSHSPMIHLALGASDFKLIETDDIDSVLNERAFESLMVTIPYKEAVIPYLDELDAFSKRIGAVNLIVHEHGRLLGYNTDYHGLKRLIERSGFDVAGKHCVIIGHGGAAKCARVVFEDLGATRVSFLVRTPKSSADKAFSNHADLADADVLLNATPLGIFPHENEAMPFSLKSFERLAVYYDLGYNPLQTAWRREASRMGIPSYGGLMMLIHQAAKARSIVDNTPLDEELTTRVLEDVYRRLSNLVLIGLPLSGKSKLAALLANRYRMPVFDTDREIEASEGCSIETIFREKGEAAFRAMELDWIKSHQSTKGVIVSTGGGMIENAQIVAILKQNGYLVFLDKNADTVWNVESTGRPLLQDKAAFQRLSERRRPLYLQAADLVIPAETPKEDILRLIEVNWHEAAHR